MEDFFCASMAGAIGRVPTHPLDTIKTISFAHDGGVKRGGLSTTTPARLSMAQSCQTIMKREGIKGFYRGLGIATVGSAPGVGTYMYTYEKSKRVFGGDKKEGGGGALVHLCSGFLAETVSCVFWVPIDVVKERLQVQHPGVTGRYRGSWDGLTTIIRNESFSGLYRGYFSTLASFGPFSAVYLMSFEYFQTLLRPLWFGRVEDSKHNGVETSVEAYRSFMLGMTAGACGNVVAGCVTNPLELVKTRLQVQRAVLTIDGKPQPMYQYTYSYKSFLEGLGSIVREEGFMGLTRGTFSRIAYAVPNAALTMGLYQSLKHTFFAPQQRHQDNVES